MIADHLRSLTKEAGGEQAEWPEKVRAKIAVTLEFFSSNPDLARFSLIAPSRAGDKIAARYRQGLERSHAAIVEGMPAEIAERAPSQAVQLSLIGGMAALVINKVDRGEGERLHELLPELLELFLGPYLGQEEAGRIARGARS